jgi:FMN-dependent NADH-azoreductase
MPTLLKIDVSPRGEHSISRQLGKTFTEAWVAAHPGSTVVTRDLAHTDLPFIEMPWIMGAYSDPAGHTAEQKEALRHGDTLIAEMVPADHILITTPMYNFNIPAKLKAWVDHVVRSGKTFRANQDGSYTGLLTGKKATVILASMGDYTPGTPAEAYDAESPYLRQILGFMGITEVEFLRAGGTYKVDRGMEPAAQFLAPLQAKVAAAAK